MLDRVLNQSELIRLVDQLGTTHRIIGPVRKRDDHTYNTVERAASLDLAFPYCAYSPKSIFFPAQETLVSYHRDTKSFATTPVFSATPPTVLVGVHPCDLNAIKLLDHVFATPQRDEHYFARRDRTLLIGIDCATPCTEGVFCRDMGANEAVDGFDLMCYRLDAEREDEEAAYGVVFGSDEGRELVVYAQIGRRPTPQEDASMMQYRQAKDAAFPKQLSCDVDTLPELLGRSYDSLLWDATARRCYSCGSCNLVCPTCYCFNTYDELDMSLNSGARRREWDGCQLRDFAVVAGEHNFRPKASARLRHRIYRKAKWVKERTGIGGCVGCARCDRACTAKISAVEIYNQLAEEE